MSQITKAIYGKVALLRAYCSVCQQESFILDKKYSCCGRLYGEPPREEKIKRESEGRNKRDYIFLKIKKQILKAQNYKCIYCENDLNGYRWHRNRLVKIKIHFDHFISWNYSRNSNKENIVASCARCNLIKSDKYFTNIESAKIYINLHIRHRYSIPISIGIPTDSLNKEDADDELDRKTLNKKERIGVSISSNAHINYFNRNLAKAGLEENDEKISFRPCIKLKKTIRKLKNSELINRPRSPFREKEHQRLMKLYPYIYVGYGKNGNRR